MLARCGHYVYSVIVHLWRAATKDINLPQMASELWA